MKNLKLLLLATLISASASWAGNSPKKTTGRGDDPKLSIGIAVGAGIPMGNFGKKDTLASNDTNNVTGYAKTGFHFHLNAGYKFSDKVGAMVQIGGNMNGFNATEWKKDNLSASNTTTTVTGTSYYVGHYMVGPFLSLPAGDKIAVNIRALFGLMTMKSSEFKISDTGFSSTSSYSNVSCFGYNIGAGLTVNASDKMGISFGLDYLGGKPTFTTQTGSTTFLSTTTSYTSGHHKIAMSTGIVNISVGIALKF